MVNRVITLLLLFVSGPVFAAEELLVRGEVRVFSEARESSIVLLTLDQGERVPISSQEYGRFRKILIQYAGKKRVGYVLESEIKNSRIRERKDDASGKSSGLAFHKRPRGSLNIWYNSVSQSKYTLDTGDGQPIKIDELSGSAVYFGFAFDYPMTSQLGLRAELNFRKSEQTGKASVQGVGGRSTDVKIGRNYFGFAALAKYFFTEHSLFFGTGGLEIAKATNVDMFFDRDKVTVPSSDYPTLVIIKVGVGAEIEIMDNIGLIPEARYIYAANTTPATSGFEIGVGVGYAF